MLFSCLPGEVKHRFVDVSHQAVRSDYFPVSVGLRSQALKLKFVTPDTQGVFLKPETSIDQTIRMFEDRFCSTLPQPVLEQSHVGDTTSLIYSPFYIEDKVVDAVLNRPVSPRLPIDWDAASMAGGRANWQLRFMPALCPDCGWDLEGRQDSVVLSCSNCATLWEAARSGYRKLKFAHLPLTGDDIVYLPFWRLRADIEGIDLTSYADLVRVANLPRVPRPGWHDIPFRFWVPAFKVRPRKFMTLSTHFTLSQPGPGLVPEVPAAALYPVTLPVKEALDSLKMIVACFLKPQQLVATLLPDIRIRARGFALIYIPFVEKHHDYVQPQFKQAVNKNMLALIARNL